MAPARSRRPGARPRDQVEEPAERADGCPFCEGNEGGTPPETLALGRGHGPPNAPGWSIRVVPNLFPAVSGSLGRQEVVVHGPRHATSIADLDESVLDDVAHAWSARASVARGARMAYVHALVNEGSSAGSSLPHAHSQLVWLADTPPAIADELARAGAGGCRLCTLLERELGDGARIVAERAGLVAFCPAAGRAPYELLVAPASCERDGFASAALGPALRLTGEVVRRLHAHEGRAPLNLWLHTSPLGEGDLHWHLELVPRLTVLAGLELGAGLYVNPLPPEEAAERLRQRP